ncbi:MAG TPA: hypothetical protein VFN30_02300 [Chitinophagaceae bacterium]|nr:hypothetical protein [Chitinophagaceae bacterium]
MKKNIFIVFIIIYLTTKAQEQNVNLLSVQNDIQNYFAAGTQKTIAVSALTIFSTKENTVGSRYFFNKWVTGKLINTKNGAVNCNGYFFDYDKIAHKIVATLDKNIVIELEDSSIQVLELFPDSLNQPIVFEKVPLIGNHFLIRIAKPGNKYTLYKSVNTKFKKADYQTNGLIATGKNYDEFVDKAEYFVVMPGKNTFEKVSLSYKSIKKVFKEDKESCERFTSLHGNDNLNEAYLIKLVNYLNS